MKGSLFAVAVAAFAVAVAGCSSVTDGGGAASTAVAVTPIAVKRATITAIVTVDVAAIATPTFSVLASASGPVTMESRLGAGKEVSAGDVVARQGGTAILSPVDATVVSLLVPDGMKVQSGVPVMTLRYGGFGVRGRVPVAQAYRLAANPTLGRVQMDAGPGLAGCTPVSIAPDQNPSTAAEGVAANASQGAALDVLCLLESSAGVIDGLTGTLGITSGVARDVLTLPVSAVAGSTEHGQVSKVVAGRSVVTDVALGISDGVRVEIKTGLEEGELVLPYGPNLRQTVVP